RPRRNGHGLRPGSGDDPPGTPARPAHLSLRFHGRRGESYGQAGADVLIPHMGLTTKGSIGAQTAMTLQEAAKRGQTLHDAAKAVNPEILVLCHGGPISEPEDAQYILSHTKGVVGFFGASSIERLPTEVAITGCVKRFKELRFA